MRLLWLLREVLKGSARAAPEPPQAATVRDADRRQWWLRWASYGARWLPKDTKSPAGGSAGWQLAVHLDLVLLGIPASVASHPSLRDGRWNCPKRVRNGCGSGVQTIPFRGPSPAQREIITFVPIPRVDGGSVQHGRWKFVVSQARNPLTVLVLFLAETLSNMLRRAATTP